MIKTAKQVLSEHGINIMELNDDFNTQLLHAMEEYKNQALEQTPSGYCRWVKCLDNIPKEKGEYCLRLLADPHNHNTYFTGFNNGDKDRWNRSYSYCEYLEESPSTIDARQIASDAWDAGYDRSYYMRPSNLSTFPAPPDKETYLSTLNTK